MKLKNRSVLYSAITLVLLFELTLMLLVYLKIGGERLPFQLIRLTIELILITWVVTNESNVSLFLLAGYYIFTGILVMNTDISKDFIGQLFIGFHVFIGVVIYFYDWIESKLGIENDLNSV